MGLSHRGQHGVAERAWAKKSETWIQITVFLIQLANI